MSQSRRIISASVDQQTAWRIQQLAREADRSTSAEVRKALREHLERQAELDRLERVYRDHTAEEGERR